MKKTTLTAEFVKDGVGNAHANWKLYKLSRPCVADTWSDTDGFNYDHICVSASIVPFDGPETYVFPADEKGNVTNWGELEGSFKGALDFQRALDGFLDAQNEVR